MFIYVYLLFFFLQPFFLFFFFNDTATTEIYTLSLHDALPIWVGDHRRRAERQHEPCELVDQDRKSTRLNSSHLVISYAVFCLKKKKNKHQSNHLTAQITLYIDRVRARGIG